jgi:hypothetical protein
MKFQKGERFRTSYSNRVYEIVGRWGSDYVLIPTDDMDNECMVYEGAEVRELLETGKFIRDEG